MEQVCQRYGGISYVTYNLTDVQHYWRLVVIEQPVYYVSYAVSGLAAISLYSEADKNYYGGVEVYRSLVEQLEENMGFLTCLEQAGLRDPFDEQVYIDLNKRYK